MFVMLLVYYKLYFTYTLSRFLFDQSNVCKDFSILEPLVIQCIPLPKKIYRHTRIRILGTLEKVEQYLSPDGSKLSFLGKSIHARTCAYRSSNARCKIEKFSHSKQKVYRKNVRLESLQD